MPGSHNFSLICTESRNKTLLRVFVVCLVIQSDSRNYFGFVVDEFSKREHTTNKMPILAFTRDAVRNLFPLHASQIF